MAVGEFYNATVDKAIVELLPVFLAPTEGTNEFAHGELSLHKLGGFGCTRHLGVALGNVPFENLAVGRPNDLLTFVAAHPGLDAVALGLPLSCQRVDRRKLESLALCAAEFLAR